MYGNKSKFNFVSNFEIPGINNLYINENLTGKRSELLEKSRKQYMKLNINIFGQKMVTSLSENLIKHKVYKLKVYKIKLFHTLFFVFLFFFVF